jgi:uncharacterized membrane protein
MADAARLDSLRRIVQVVYALQALALVGGVLGSGTIAAQFLFLVPAVAALAVDYPLRARAAGSWLGSHCQWQLHTFWLALAMAAVLFLVSAALLVVMIGAWLPGPGLALIGAWAGYRVLHGWLNLRERQPMPVPMEAT